MGVAVPTTPEITRFDEATAPDDATVLPGESTVDTALVDEATRHLNLVSTPRTLDRADEVGRYILDTFFLGAPRWFRERGRGHRSFQTLVARPDLRFSSIWVWRAVGIHEQLSVLPTPIATALPYSHHALLLALESPDEKLDVARRAVDARWTRDQLQAAVTSARGARGRRGRPPLPPLVKTLHRIESLLSDDSMRAFDAVGDLPPDEQRRVHRTLRRMLRRMEQMVDDLQPLFEGK